MHFIEPSVEYWPQENSIKGIWKQVARAVQVPYQGQRKEEESNEDYVKRVILKPALIKGDLKELETCTFDIDKLHGGVLEFGVVYLKTFDAYCGELFKKDKHSIVNEDPFNRYYITTNLRCLIENHVINCLQYLCEPEYYHHKHYTFNVITDVGVTREFNRHRASMSIVEQSSRYCNYTKERFNNEITFITPAWANRGIDKATIADTILLQALQEAESAYFALIEEGWKPEQARQVLPLSTKTQAVYCASYEAWQHFLSLRSYNVSGRSHPNMKIVADEINRYFKEEIYSKE